MGSNRYEYETSPRKLQPDVQRKKQKRNKRRKLKIVQDIPRDNIKLSKEQKRKQIKLTLVVIGIFMLLLTISYRNSRINEKFNEVQTLKKELSSIEKENEQLKVSIENSLNLNTIEKIAKEKLGMQKLTKNKTVYINLPKKDYVEPASEEIIVNKQNEKNWFEKIIDIIRGQ